jgi:hypothetical protein
LPELVDVDGLPPSRARDGHSARTVRGVGGRPITPPHREPTHVGVLARCANTGRACRGTLSACWRTVSELSREPPRRGRRGGRK